MKSTTRRTTPVSTRCGTVYTSLSVKTITAIIAPGPAMEGTASGNTARSRPSSGDPSVFASHFPEKHLHAEQEQNDAAGHFERVHVNADCVENDLAGGRGDHENDSGVNDSAQRRHMPLRPCERS